MKTQNSLDKPVVLLHGAGLGGWIWESVTHRLAGPALAVDLPGREQEYDFSNTSLDDLAQFVVEQVEERGFQKAVLVAHSVSGVLALRCRTIRPDLFGALVFVGAAIPQSGQSYGAALGFMGRTMLALLARIYPQGLKAPAGVARKALCNGLEDEQASQIVARMVAEAPALFTHPVEWTQPDEAFYIVLTNDKSDLKPKHQRQMAERINAQVHTIASGHLPMFDSPAKVAEVINLALGVGNGQAKVS